MTTEDPELANTTLKLELQKIKESWRSIFFLLALILIAETLRILPNKTQTESYAGATFAWAAAIVSYSLAMTPQMNFWRKKQRHWRSDPRIYVAGGIFLLGFFLRAWQVNTVPFTVGGDEGSQGLEAVRVINGLIKNPFSTGWGSVPTLSFFFNSLGIRLFGQNTLGLRAPWMLLGAITVLIVFYLVQHLKGTRLAIATAVLVAAYHYHIHFSRLGSNQIADPFFLSLAMLCMHRALDHRSRLDWTLTGVVTGLAFYFYAGARLTLLVIITTLAYLWLKDRKTFWLQHRLGLLVALGAFLITAAPMIQFAARFPDDFNARVNQVGIIQSGWLAKEVDIKGTSTAAVLFDQFKRAALAFNIYPDRTGWYGLDEPLLHPFFGFVFIVGLLYATFLLFGKHSDPHLVSMVAWWWAGMILGGMLTESPPSSQRLITLAVPVCFFIALAAWEILQLAAQFQKQLPTNTLLGLIVVLFGISSIQTYFVAFIPQRRYGGGHAEIATEIAPRLRAMANDYYFYFAGAPEMYWGFGTIPYLAPEAQGDDILEQISPDVLGQDNHLELNPAFIFLPNRLDELPLVRQVYPTGEEVAYYSPVDTRLMVVFYIPSEP